MPHETWTRSSAVRTGGNSWSIWVHAGLKSFVACVDGKTEAECQRLADLIVAAPGQAKRIEELQNVLRRLVERVKDMNTVLVLAGLVTETTDPNLPTLADLKGIAPDIAGGVASEDYVREMRDIDEEPTDGT